MPTNGILNGSKPAERDVYIVSALRSPIGSFNGSLASLKASDLAGQVIRKTLQDIMLPPEFVEKVTLGQALQAGSGQAPAKQALKTAGMANSTRDCLVNEVCASGMQAIILSAIQIKYLGAECLIAGGMESMTNVPKYQDRLAPMLGDSPTKDGLLQDGLRDTFYDCHMGNCAEHAAKRFFISREDQDEYAIESYRRAKVAAETGLLKSEICPINVPGKGSKPPSVFDMDEEFKKLDLDKVKTLRPCFDKMGTITAANASSLSDGAAVCCLMSSSGVDNYRVKPLAKIVAFGEDACDPMDFATSPIEAIKDALKKASLNVEDISLWEVNEAFSVVPLAVMKALKIDHAKMNVNGGGVSIGHPLGMSGARIVNVLVHQLQEGQFGCAAICRGGGGSAAVIIKKLWELKGESYWLWGVKMDIAN